METAYFSVIKIDLESLMGHIQSAKFAILLREKHLYLDLKSTVLVTGPS
jgi:hypothetical protein